MGTIVFLGDSITDARRLESANGLGFGYVNKISDKLKQGNDSWTILNRGVDGFTAERSAHNVDRDCITNSPDYVSILVGINDIGIIMNTAATHSQKLYLMEDCLRAYHQLLFDLSHHTHAQILTLEPFIFPYPQEYVNWMPWQKKLSKQIKKLARNYKAAFAPLHNELNQLAGSLGYDAVTEDGIHLTERGHELLAKTVLNCWDL